MQDDEIDLIDVTVPTYLHAEFALKALRAGKHVLVETPACTTEDECREIKVELSKHPELKSATGHICRHWPTYKAAKRLVDSGELGKIFYTESDYAHDIDPEIYPPPPHKWEPHVMGRLSISYHSVDILRHVVGDVEDVAGYVSDDASLAMLRFKNGALGKVFSSGKVTRPYIMSLQIYGLKGTLICVQEEDELRGYWHKSRYWEPEMLEASVNHGKGTPKWKMEMENVVDSILDDKQPLCILEEGVSTVETCIAIDTAMTKCVGVPDVLPEGLEMLRRGGTYVETGNFVEAGSVLIDVHRHIAAKNALIIGNSNHPHTGYYQAMKMMQKYADVFPFEKLITHIYKLEDAETAILKSLEPDCLKVVFAP